VITDGTTPEVLTSGTESLTQSVLLDLSADAPIGIRERARRRRITFRVADSIGVSLGETQGA